MAQAGSRLTIVEWEEDVDLRAIRWTQGNLERIARKYKLKHAQCVVFTNDANKSLRRWRAVARFWGLAVLILTPVDDQARHSIELQIAEFMRQMAGGDQEIIEHIDAEQDLAQRRLERQKRRAKLARERTA